MKVVIPNFVRAKIQNYSNRDANLFVNGLANDMNLNFTNIPTDRLMMYGYVTDIAAYISIASRIYNGALSGIAVFGNDIYGYLRRTNGEVSYKKATT